MQHVCCIPIMITAELTKVSQLNHLEISAVKLAKYKSKKKNFLKFPRSSS